jgi:hypothetical protein
MERSIEEAERGVQSAVQRARAWAESSEPATFWVFEAGLWTLMLALGRALSVLFLTHRARAQRPSDYVLGGKRYRIDGERTSELGTRFGKVRFHRPVGRLVSDGRASADLPVDRELGLCSGFSLGVVQGMARLGAQMAFASARETFHEFCQWAPSPRAVLRMVDTLGERARTFLEGAPAPDDDGDVLCIQVDGRGAPMISEGELKRRRRPHRKRNGGTKRRYRRLRRKGRPRVRRTKGKKSKNAKVAVVGVIYTLHRTPEGVEGPINKRIFATFASHEELFVWLRREADKRGYGSKRTIFLADGCEHIWRLQKSYFPKAEACIDWYHVVEYLWSAGQSKYAEGSDELRGWVKLQTQRLRRGWTRVILADLRQMRRAIPNTGPGTAGKRERLDDTIRYFENNVSRMIYRDLRRDDLDIGSGAVEGAVRNLVAMRLDGPGMRWSRGRSERILHLRCILLNGQWSEFTRYLATLDQTGLAAKPIPTTSHCAKKAA